MIDENVIKNSRENKSWIGTWPSAGNEEPTIEVLNNIKEMQEHINSLVCPICSKNRSIACIVLDHRNSEFKCITLILQCQLDDVHNKKICHIPSEVIKEYANIDDLIKKYLQYCIIKEVIKL